MSTNFRMSYNNLAAADGVVLSASSALASFPASYAVDPFRSKKWKPKGSFRIDATNNKIYINDGTAQTATLTSAVYETGSDLATEIQTQLNAVSSSWTCTYSSTTGLFTIDRTAGTKTLVLTTTTTAAWDTLGYLGVADQDAAVADIRRNHTSERYAIDILLAQTVMFFAVYQSPDSQFCISDTATCYLKGSATNDYDTATYSVAVTPTASGIYYFPDSAVDTELRYWWFDFIDRENTDGPEGFSLKIWLGDYVSPAGMNLVSGFSARTIDPSLIRVSSNGVKYFNRKTKYLNISNLGIEWLSGADRVLMNDAYAYCGKTRPVFVSIDPTAIISSGIDEFTKLMYFDDDPDQNQLRYNMYAFKLSFTEVIG